MGIVHEIIVRVLKKILKCENHWGRVSVVYKTPVEKVPLSTRKFLFLQTIRNRKNYEINFLKIILPSLKISNL